MFTQKSPTDWEKYYQNPSFFSKFTRKTTERILINTLKARHARRPIQSICELGGGNSCFFAAIRSAFPDVQYTIVDNNALSVELFKQKGLLDKRVDIQIQDVLALDTDTLAYDVVFSVGLIEHFSVRDTAKMIKRHFQMVQPGGLVLMTFPTPTWLYKTIRFFCERFNRWIFHDERPLALDEVTNEVVQYAEVIARFINWKTLLTQGIVIGTDFKA